MRSPVRLEMSASFGSRSGRSKSVNRLPAENCGASSASSALPASMMVQQLPCAPGPSRASVASRLRCAC